jgi:GNAT superfamily N-acetyltransferase
MGSFRFVTSGNPDCPAPEDLFDGYVRCLMQLHKGCTAEAFPFKQFEALFDCQTEIVGFVLDEQGIVRSTAQTSIIFTMPLWQVAINNVVTDRKFQGRGLGRMVMEGLVEEISCRWGTPLKPSLTNRPNQNNGGFYKSLGWRSRGPDSDDPTVVWVMDL